MLFNDEAWAASLLFRARTGDVTATDALIAERPEFLRPPQAGSICPLGVWDRISATAEALVVLGRLDEAAEFHATLEAYHGRGAVLRWLDGRLHQTVLAMTATAAGRWEEAEAGFAEALALAERLPHTIEQADTRRDWAGALMRRNAAGDRMRALELLAEAAEPGRNDPDSKIPTCCAWPKEGAGWSASRADTDVRNWRILLKSRPHHLGEAWLCAVAH